MFPKLDILINVYYSLLKLLIGSILAELKAGKIVEIMDIIIAKKYINHLIYTNF